jgi:hypothetical protein
MDDIPKMRACYYLYKRDPSILVDPPQVEETQKKPAAKEIDMYEGFSWRPRQIYTAYMSSGEHGLIRDESDPTKKYKKLIHKPDHDMGLKLFNHMCNHVARTHDHKTRKPLLPSGGWDCEVSQDQEWLLNPSPYDVVMGTIMEDAVGERAKKKIAKRRVDMITGNIHSYARSMNNPDQLEDIKEYATLSSILAELAADKDETRKRLAQEKEKQQQERAAKKAAQAEKDKKKAEELLPGIEQDIEKGLEHVLKLSVSKKKDILKYKYGVTSGLAKMNKEALDAYLRDKIEQVSATATEDNTNTGTALHSTASNT